MRRRKNRTEGEWLAVLRGSWGDLYEVTVRRRRLRKEWEARRRSFARFPLAARDPAALGQAMRRDWVAEKEREACAAEQAAAGAKTQAIDRFPLPPMPRLYAPQCVQDDARWPS